jgi:SAM-dependent methyltransferase
MAEKHLHRYQDLTAPGVYSAIAPIYDQIMEHVEYHEWFDLIKSIMKRFSLAKSAPMLEIGGGTGILGSLFSESGFNYTGSDLSFSMAREANKKGLTFFCADGRSLPVKKKFDLVFFLYDGINYLPTLSAYRQLFSAVGQILTSHGLFLFDITTEYNSRCYFADFLDYSTIDEVSVIRHSYFKKQQSQQINDFTIFSPCDSSSTMFRRHLEHHSQKLFTPEQIRSVIPVKQFECIGVYDGFSNNNYNSTSERIHFLLQKKS